MSQFCMAVWAELSWAYRLGLGRIWLMWAGLAPVSLVGQWDCWD